MVQMMIRVGLKFVCRFGRNIGLGLGVRLY
jgi:hypothetical protein